MRNEILDQIEALRSDLVTDSQNAGVDHKTINTKLEMLLLASLSAYVLHNSEKPICTLMNDLLNLEIKAGKIVHAVLKDSINLRGALRNVLSFVPLSTQGDTAQKIIDVQPTSSVLIPVDDPTTIPS